jgi:hypothetical protein
MKILHFYGSFALLSSFVLTSAVARGQTPSSNDDERKMQAQSLIDHAQKVVDSDPKGALAALRASYDVQPDYRVLYNVGLVCVRLADTQCATKSFEQYLKEGGAQVPAKRKKEIDAQLKTLLRAGALSITSAAADAEVRIDGTVVGKTPLAKPVPVGPGNHVVVLVVNGAATEKTVRIAPGETQKLEIDPQAEPPPPAAPPPSPPPAAAPSPPPSATTTAPPVREASHGVPIIPWVITGALAAGTVTAGILTQRMNDRYSALNDIYPISREELDATYAKTKNLMMLTGALGGATVISLGFALYKTIFHGAPAPAADKGVGVAVGPAGIAIGGRL